LAVSDASRTVATPLETIDAGDAQAADWPARLAERLAEVATRTACEMIVVGLPRSMSGRDTASTRMARGVAAALERAGWTVELWDERLSSAEAERVMLAAGSRRKERRAGRDRIAATLILQGWLDARGN
jgi:putative holliday junction resolvase